jgi:hypothetical protein
MSGQEKEWLTPTEIAAIVIKHGIDGFPTEASAVNKFLRRHAADHPDLARPKTMGSKNMSTTVRFWTFTGRSVVAIGLPSPTLWRRSCRDLTFAPRQQT